MRETRRLGAAGLAVAMALALAPAASAQGHARAAEWHVLEATQVESARLTEDVVMSTDSNVTSTTLRKGGQGNIEICGFARTEPISVSRQIRWDAGDRTGATMILQLQSFAAGGTAFARMKKAYVACTPAKFGGSADPADITVKGSYLKKKKTLRMDWAIYNNPAHEITIRAEGLSVKRAGAALIITRSITKDFTTLRDDISLSLTTRQFAKYKAAAYT